MIRGVQLDPDLDLFTNPGSKGQRSAGSWIRNTASTYNSYFCSIRWIISKGIKISVPVKMWKRRRNIRVLKLQIRLVN
jgi:hypothetical protein